MPATPAGCIEPPSEAQAARTARFQAGDVLVLGAGHAAHDIYTAFLPPLLPVFIANLALSRTEAGLLSVFLQAPSLLQPFLGHLADRFNLRYLVILAPAVAAILMSLLGVLPGYGLLVVFLTAAGINTAGIHTVGPAMVGAISGRKMGQGMSLWMVGGEVARTLGPIIVVTTVQLFSLQAMPWLMIGGLIASAILYVRLKDLPVRSPGFGQEIPWRQALRAMRPLLAPLIGIVTVRAFMFSALTTYLPVFLREEGADLWFAGASLSLLEAAGVVGALLGGSLSDRWGRRRILFFTLATTPVLMFLFLFAKDAARLPILLALGLTALSIAPVVMALVVESFPESRALASGVYMGLSFSVRSVAIVVLGLVGDRFGMRLAFTLSAITPLAGVPLLLLLPRDRRGPGTPLRPK